MINYVLLCHNRLKTRILVKIRLLIIRGIFSRQIWVRIAGSYHLSLSSAKSRGKWRRTNFPPSWPIQSRSDRFKRAGDAGWYRPFVFADGQLRGSRRFDIDDKYGRFRLAATGLRGF